MGKYGTNLEGFGAFEGGVNADKGAPLVSTSSDGASALIFGPAALREIQAGVANGDFAIRPDAAGDNITAENPLPYWTATPASNITIKTIDQTDIFVGSGSGVALLFVVAANTPLDAEASIFRYVPIAATYNRAHSYYPEVMVSSGSSSDIGIQVTIGWYDQNLSFISNGPSRLTTTIAPGLVTPSGPNTNQAAPDNAAFALFKITIIVTGAGGSGGSVKNIVISEVRLSRGDSTLLVSEQTSPSTYAPSLVQQLSGVLTITPAVSVQVDGDLVIDGANSEYVARVTATAAQSLTNNTLTKITFNTASSTPTIGSYDPQGWFDNAADSIVIGQDGFYNITANVGFATNSTSRRLVLIYVNGSDRAGIQVPASPAGTTLLSVSTNVYLVAGDEVQVYALQQSGGALNTVASSGVTPVLAVGRIGA